MIRSILATAVMLAAASAVNAQTPRDTLAHDTIYRIAPIRVQTARAVTAAGGASAVEVRLDSLALAPVSTVADVLRALPLVQVRTNSRGEVHFSLRGSGSDTRQAAVLLDGVPLTLGWDARSDLSVIPTTAARTLTLTRGAPSVLYGPNALGGVVSIGVASALDRSTTPSFELGSSIDHTGAYSAAASGTGVLDAGAGFIAVRGGFGWRDRAGLARPGGVHEPGLRTDDVLTNTDTEQIDAFLGGRYTGGAGQWLSLSTSGFLAERGVAPELHVQEPRLWRYPHVARGVFALAGGTGVRNLIGGGSGDAELSIGVDVGSNRIDSYATRAYDSVIESEEGDDRTLTVRLLGDHTLGARTDLSAALTYADITHDELLDGEPETRYRQRLWSAATELNWRPRARAGAGEWSFTAGAVADGADTPETGGRPALDALTAWGARFGATRVVAGGTALLHGAVSRRARFPALRELYSGALGRFEPNPTLRPEELIVAEAGATAQLGGAEVQGVLFHHRLSDAVVRITTPAGRFRRVNRDEMRSYGVEALASTTVHGIALAADLTLQDVALIDPGAPEDQNEPEYQPRVIAGLHASAPLFAGLNGNAQLRYTDTQFCVHPDLGADVEIDAATRVDLQLARGFGVRRGSALLSRMELSAALDNALDATTYDQCGIPQPGRTLRLQLRLF